MQKVVVTGGLGFIGSHLVKALLERGFDVHVIDNFAGGLMENRFNKGAVYHALDVRDPSSKKVFEGAIYVFHLAALPRVQFSIEQPYDAHDANINGTMCVLLAAREAGVKKVIYSASSSAYGDQDIMPLEESMPANPKSPYALQKYVGEMYCKLFTTVYGLPTVSLRYFNAYGPKADPNGPYAQVIPKFIEMRLNGKPMTITGTGEQTRDLVYVTDIVEANILAALSENTGGGEVINIGTGKNISIKKIAELIGGPVEYVPERLEPHDTVADNTRARTLLGWKPSVSVEQGIAELKKLAGIE